MAKCENISEGNIKVMRKLAKYEMRREGIRGEFVKMAKYGYGWREMGQ
jgi:hypothetical protein